ncbi:MAG: hypothetical protein QM811_29005 [Pirellulales bacterium]
MVRPPAARVVVTNLSEILRRAERSGDAAELRTWLEERRAFAGVADGTAEIAWAYATSAIARAMPFMVETLSADEWWATLDELRQVATDARALTLEERPLLAQLLAGELPLTLATRFPEIAACAADRGAAFAVLARGFDELLDGEGTPHQRHWAIQRPLAACWTRCGVLSDEPFPLADYGVSAEQFPDVVRETRRARANDSQVLLSTQAPDDASGFAAFLAVAERLADDVRRRMKKLKRKTPKPKPEPQDDEQDEKQDLNGPSKHAEWSQLAVFRTQDDPRAPTLAMMYAGQAQKIELGVAGDVLISGDWTWELAVDGRILEAASEWTEACHIGDQDVDYLELELDLEQGWKIERRIVLGRKDRFALLADAISGPHGAESFNVSHPAGADRRRDRRRHGRDA